jgi:hypothetical protein
MTSKCWRVLASDCFRRVMWLGSLLMLAFLFVVPAHACALPANSASPRDPGTPGVAPARSATFGIGPNDSVFARVERFRVVYDWRGNHFVPPLPRIPPLR